MFKAISMCVLPGSGSYPAAQNYEIFLFLNGRDTASFKVKSFVALPRPKTCSIVSMCLDLYYLAILLAHHGALLLPGPGALRHASRTARHAHRPHRCGVVLHKYRPPVCVSGQN